MCGMTEGGLIDSSQSQEQKKNHGTIFEICSATHVWRYVREAQAIVSVDITAQVDITAVNQAS